MGQLHHLHGSIFDVKWTKCDIIRKDDKADQAIRPLLDHDLAIVLTRDQISRCPMATCDGLLCPGVVWLTESVPQHVMKTIHDWMSDLKDQVANIDTRLGNNSCPVRSANPHQTTTT